ncbi:putative uncharacterized protein C3orf49 homolog [Petaurus breviceps papuanus]|uniref:putative uncharacterized protein C3orf49 homolog n=1 Tax=Petaurus breviceps papuanus TaxID=3040969 RepID=UPI0036DEE26F
MHNNTCIYVHIPGACAAETVYGKGRQPRSFPPTKRKHEPLKRKGIERWHRAVSTNLVKQNVLVPKEESSSGSDLESQQSPENKKKNFMKKIKTAFRRTLPEHYRIKVARSHKSGPSNHKEALFSNTQSLLPRITKERPSHKLFAKPQIGKLPQNATIQLDVVEAETEEITGGNTLVRARRTTKRLSVTSLPSGLQKAPYLSKKRRRFPVLRKKKANMENILCASDLTVGKLQMQCWPSSVMVEQQEGCPEGTYQAQEGTGTLSTAESL